MFILVPTSAWCHKQVKLVIFIDNTITENQRCSFVVVYSTIVKSFFVLHYKIFLPHVFNRKLTQHYYTKKIIYSVVTYC